MGNGGGGVRWPVLSSRRERHDRQRRLDAGEPVELAARIRRTTTRGWGPWTDGALLLAARTGGKSRWRVADPTAIGLAADQTSDGWEFDDVERVTLRDVRFREEAFYGQGGSIIVVSTDRSTMEIALPSAETGEALVRLAATIGPHELA
jgi:hypothetical protein